MTLVVAPSHELVLADSAELQEVPSYRLVPVRSEYDQTEATNWFYISRALMIQRAWRGHRGRLAFLRQREAVYEVRAARVQSYYNQRMQRLLYFIAWEGHMCDEAAKRIQTFVRWRLRTTKRLRRTANIIRLEEIAESKKEKLF